MKKRKKLAWYAAHDGARILSPFESQAEAWLALKLTPSEQQRQKRVHAAGAYVWCEERWAREEE